MEEYTVSEPDPTMERPNNFTYLDYFHLLRSRIKLSGTYGLGLALFTVQ